MKITVYTTPTCAYCGMVKKYLTSKGKEYDIVDLDEQPDARQSLFEATGAITVPIIQVNDQYIIGWQPGQLAAAIA